MNSLKAIFTTIAFFCITSIFSQDYLFSVEELTTKEGLSNINTSATYQDKEGFLWIGTGYGLNRFDGYQFKLFTKEKNGLHRNNILHKIAKGEKDNLWLFYSIDETTGSFLGGEINHIDILDTKTEKVFDFETYFKNKLPFQINEIKALTINDAKNRPWVVTQKTNCICLKISSLKKYFKPRIKTLRLSQLMKMIIYLLAQTVN